MIAALSIHISLAMIGCSRGKHQGLQERPALGAGDIAHCRRRNKRVSSDGHDILNLA
jgi:hypothetical protein